MHAVNSHTCLGVVDTFPRLGALPYHRSAQGSMPCRGSAQFQGWFGMPVSMPLRAAARFKRSELRQIQIAHGAALVYILHAVIVSLIAW